MNEADTCRTYVLPKLKSAGWDDEMITEQMVLTPGRIVPIGDRHTRKQGLRPDYTLFFQHSNNPIAVVEAKADYAHPGKGLGQAKRNWVLCCCPCWIGRSKVNYEDPKGFLGYRLTRQSGRFCLSGRRSTGKTFRVSVDGGQCGAGGIVAKSRGIGCIAAAPYGDDIRVG